jgi:hypothetical protein
MKTYLSDVFFAMLIDYLDRNPQGSGFCSEVLCKLRSKNFLLWIHINLMAGCNVAHWRQTGCGLKPKA